MPCNTYGKFYLFLHPNTFNCYTFKYNQNLNSSLSTGPYKGLSLILKTGNPLIYTYDKTQPVGNVDGLKVVIHAPDTVPYVMDRGIEVHPGESTNIGIVMKNFKRLGSPFGKCTKEAWVRDIYRNEYKLDEKLCQQTARFYDILEACSCYETAIFPNKYFTDYTKNCMYINPNNFSEFVGKFLCAVHTIENYQAAPDTDNCSWSCEETDYDLTISETVWPKAVMIPDFIGW